MVIKPKNSLALDSYLYDFIVKNNRENIEISEADILK